MPLATEPHAPPKTHLKCVHAWLHRQGVHDTADERMGPLLLFGLRTIWERSRPALGAVMLTAIFERAFGALHQRYVALTRVGLRIHDRSSVEMLVPSAFTQKAGSAAPFVLAELLDILDRLTAQTLTPVLHNALLEARLPGDRR